MNGRKKVVPTPAPTSTPTKKPTPAKKPVPVQVSTSRVDVPNTKDNFGLRENGGVVCYLSFSSILFILKKLFHY